MVTLKLTDEQVIELVKQLPPEGKQAVVNALRMEGELWWEFILAQGEDQLRLLCAERGLDWDTLSEEKREDFIDQLLHES